MNREEAAQMLKRLKYDYQNGADENDCFYDMYLYALDTAITILTSPWVKTSGKLPAEADADNTMCWVLATTISSDLPMPEAIAYIRANPDNYPYWMPIPPLPEVEE